MRRTAGDERPSLSGYQRQARWLNDGLGRFTDVAQVVGVTDTDDGRAVAVADLSNRGVHDVIVPTSRGPLLISRTRCSLAVTGLRLRSNGLSVIGARLAPASSCSGMADAGAGSPGGNGFQLAERSAGCTTRIGGATKIGSLVIRWPSGKTGRSRAPASTSPRGERAGMKRYLRRCSLPASSSARICRSESGRLHTPPDGDFVAIAAEMIMIG